MEDQAALVLFNKFYAWTGSNKMMMMRIMSLNACILKKCGHWWSKQRSLTSVCVDLQNSKVVPQLVRQELGKENFWQCTTVALDFSSNSPGASPLRQMDLVMVGTTHLSRSSSVQYWTQPASAESRCSGLRRLLRLMNSMLMVTLSSYLLRGQRKGSAATSWSRCWALRSTPSRREILTWKHFMSRNMYTRHLLPRVLECLEEWWMDLSSGFRLWWLGSRHWCFGCKPKPTNFDIGNGSRNCGNCSHRLLKNSRPWFYCALWLWQISPCAPWYDPCPIASRWQKNVFFNRKWMRNIGGASTTSHSAVDSSFGRRMLHLRVSWKLPQWLLVRCLSRFLKWCHDTWFKPRLVAY